MNKKLYNNLFLFSLFGIALGFFGILYEGVVYGPKLLDHSMPRMLFWKGFFANISPIIYYTPLNQLAAIALVVLFFMAPKQNTLLKQRLKWAAVLQIVSFGITFYVVSQLNLKQSFGDIGKYADEIPYETVLFNILSVCRLAIVAIALSLVFKGYIQTQREQN